MIFNVQQIIETVSKVMTLQEADVILTGSPGGTGRVIAGDRIEAGLGLVGQREPLLTMKFNVIDRAKPIVT